MPRDIQERFNDIKIPVVVKEIALTKDDIAQYNLPKIPVKTRDKEEVTKKSKKKKDDPRKNWYIQKYGIDYGVELDALPPDVLRNKIKSAIFDFANSKQIENRRSRDNKEKEEWRNRISSFS
jgi:hypothetical protein